MLTGVPNIWNKEVAEKKKLITMNSRQTDFMFFFSCFHRDEMGKVTDTPGAN